MLFTAAAGAVLALAASQGNAQTPATSPEFEVATVKVNASGCCTSAKWSGDQVVFSNQTLTNLVMYAYGLQYQQLIAPEWMKTARFDVTGRYPPGTTFDQGLLMLRSLLQDRFKLAVHHDTKEMQAYELVIAQGGFKLKPTEPGRAVTGGNVEGSIRTFWGRKASMFDLAYDLADSLGEPVIDKTGIKGVYDFRMTWAADDLSKSDADEAKVAPSVFTALQESLGLRLEHRKTSVPVVVVDHADRTPSEN